MLKTDAFVDILLLANPYVAVTVTLVVVNVPPATTLNVALEDPAGTVTMDGTANRLGSLDTRDMFAPPAGAGPGNTISPVAPKNEKITFGVIVNCDNGATIVRGLDAELIVFPPAMYCAVMLTLTVDLTALVGMLTDELVVAPSGMVTLAGGVAAEGVSLDNVTVTPPGGAGD